MKDLFFYLPKELDIKSIFREWLQDNYIPYLQSKNYLKTKYDRYKNDKTKGIEQFLTYNNEINYKRLLIFIGDLYSPLQKNDQEKEYKIPFINRMASIQRMYLGRDYRDLYVKEFCIDASIVQSDNWYYSYSDDARGSKATGYRIHPRLYSSNYTWERKRVRVNEKVYNNYKGINQSNKFENYPDLIKDILNMMDGWYLDDSAIDGRYDKYVEKYNTFKDTKGRFTYSGIGNRIYSVENNLKKELRPYLKHEDNPDAEYQILDLSNSHVYALAYYLLNETKLMKDQPLKKPKKYKLDAIEDELNLINELCIHLHIRKGSDDNKQIIVNHLTNLLIPTYKDVQIDFESVYTSLTGELTSIPYKDDLVDLMKTEDKRLLLFIILACSGLIFDVSAQRMEMTRKEFKTQFNKGVNLRNEKFKIGFNPAVKFLDKFFPQVFDFICELKGNSNVNYLHQMSKIESDIMIFYLSQYLMDEGVEFINIHDGLMYPKTVENFEFELLRYKRFRLHIPYTLEEL